VAPFPDCIVDLTDIAKDTEVGPLLFGGSKAKDYVNESFDKSRQRFFLYQRVQKKLEGIRDIQAKIVKTCREWRDNTKHRKVKPRWTEQDEQHYRAKLDEYDVDAERALLDLKNQEDRIKELIEEAKYLRDGVKNDMNLHEARISTRSAEDVRLFTYVTVVFLPLGFSASLYSMSAPPSGAVIVALTKTSIIALIITVVGLFNAKAVDRQLKRGAVYIDGITDSARSRMESSPNWRWRGVAEELAISEARNAESREERVEHESFWWYVWWLICYFTFELPALRVGLGLEAIHELANRLGSKHTEQNDAVIAKEKTSTADGAATPAPIVGVRSSISPSIAAAPNGDRSIDPSADSASVKPPDIQAKSISSEDITKNESTDDDQKTVTTVGVNEKAVVGIPKLILRLFLGLFFCLPFAFSYSIFFVCINAMDLFSWTMHRIAGMFSHISRSSPGTASKETTADDETLPDDPYRRVEGMRAAASKRADREEARKKNLIEKEQRKLDQSSNEATKSFRMKYTKLTHPRRFGKTNWGFKNESSVGKDNDSEEGSLGKGDNIV
jgi:CorA-like Mg2+ transporter protein